MQRIVIRRIATSGNHRHGSDLVAHGNIAVDPVGWSLQIDRAKQRC
jgi:hypothetical protein